MAARSRLAKKELERRGDSGASKAISSAPQPPIRPDDTFYRVVNAMYGGEATGKSEQAADTPAHPANIPEPEIPEEATIRDLVSGTTPPSGMPGITERPEQVPEINEQPKQDEED